MNTLDPNHGLLKPDDWAKGDELQRLHAAKLRAAQVPVAWLHAEVLRPQVRA